jgi:hypothetical protein
MARKQIEPGAESAAEEAVEKAVERAGVEVPAGSSVPGVPPPSEQGTSYDTTRAKAQAYIEGE